MLVATRTYGGRAAERLVCNRFRAGFATTNQRTEQILRKMVGEKEPVITHPAQLKSLNTESKQHTRRMAAQRQKQQELEQEYNSKIDELKEKIHIQNAREQEYYKWREDLVRRLQLRRADWAAHGVLQGTPKEKIRACLAARATADNPLTNYRKSYFDPVDPATLEEQLHEKQWAKLELKPKPASEPPKWSRMDQHYAKMELNEAGEEGTEEGVATASEGSGSTPESGQAEIPVAEPAAAQVPTSESEGKKAIAGEPEAAATAAAPVPEQAKPSEKQPIEEAPVAVALPKKKKSAKTSAAKRAAATAKKNKVESAPPAATPASASSETPVSPPSSGKETPTDEPKVVSKSMFSLNSLFQRGRRSLSNQKSR